MVRGCATGAFTARKQAKKPRQTFVQRGCGGGGIRTHGTHKGTTVFETAPFNHSGTPPRAYLKRT